jgi:hypothetical protein
MPGSRPCERAGVVHEPAPASVSSQAREKVGPAWSDVLLSIRLRSSISGANSADSGFREPKRWPIESSDILVFRSLRISAISLLGAFPAAVHRGVSDLGIIGARKVSKALLASLPGAVTPCFPGLKSRKRDGKVPDAHRGNSSSPGQVRAHSFAHAPSHLGVYAVVSKVSV